MSYRAAAEIVSKDARVKALTEELDSLNLKYENLIKVCTHVYLCVCVFVRVHVCVCLCMSAMHVCMGIRYCVNVNRRLQHTRNTLVSYYDKRKN